MLNANSNNEKQSDCTSSSEIFQENIDYEILEHHDEPIEETTDPNVPNHPKPIPMYLKAQTNNE